MTKPIHGAVLSALGLLGAALLPLWAGAHASAPQPLVVIISTVKTPITNLSAALLRRAFEGYPTDHDGVRLVPLAWPADTPERAQFDRVVLRMTPEEVGAFWVDQRIRGAARAPRTVPSPQLAVRAVAALPGGITYTRPSLVTAAVRIVRIDGKGPSDPGYLLAPQ